MRYLIVLLTFIFVAELQSGDDVDWSKVYQGVSMSELINNPDKFNGKRIAVFGFFHFYADFAYLYAGDKHCLGGGDGIELDRSGPFYEESGEKIYRNADIKFNGRWGTIKGIFSGEELKIEDDGRFVNNQVIKDISNINLCETCGELPPAVCRDTNSACCVYPDFQGDSE